MNNKYGAETLGQGRQRANQNAKQKKARTYESQEEGESSSGEIPLTTHAAPEFKRISQFKLSRNFFCRKKHFSISSSHFNILSKKLRNMIGTYVYNIQLCKKIEC